LALVLSNLGWMPTVEATSHTVSGRVTDGAGSPVQGVTITAQAEMQYRLYLPVAMNGYAQGGIPKTGFGLLQAARRVETIGAQALATYTAVTDADGNYTLTGLPAGTYTLVPAKGGQVFSPPSRTVAVPPDASGQDFETSSSEPDLFDSVLYMTADTGYALVDDNASLDLGVGDGDDFTIEAFFYVPDLTYDDFYTDVLARKRDSFSFYISFNAGQPDWILFEITTAGGGDVTLGYQSHLQVGWHHVAASYDNEYTETEDALAIFLDGSRVAYSPEETVHVDWTPGIPNSWRPLEVGGVQGGRAGFNGYLEEIRVSDMIRYSNGTYTVPTDPFASDAHTVALWHFDEAAGSTNFYDASSYGNHLTGYSGAQTYNP